MLLFLLAACGNECDDNATRCDGNAAETCNYVWDNEVWGHWELSREECGAGACQLPPAGAEGAAFCALDGEADPACPAELGAEQRASRCVEGQVRTWTYCYRIAEETCADPSACVDAAAPGFDPACETVAFCADPPAPDPLCTEGVFTACEDETTIVYCSCGFRSAAHPCSDPGPTCTLVEVEGLPPQGACR